MEGTPTAADSPAAAEPASSRRRAGGLKRKANSVSASTFSSSTPSKRTTREKSTMPLFQSQFHNGPLTRAARHTPTAFASSPGDPAAARSAKLEEKERVALAAAMATAAAAEEERLKLEGLEKKIEAEFEAIRSRDSHAHVVPNHCGWFSWTKVHSLEERALPTFFNGKSQSRTPATYMEIRNSIVKKFHLNPNEQIELKDLSDLEVADMDVRQEVLEFLDYWGLINFHPFPQTDASGNSRGDVATKDSLLEKLFQFGPVPSSPNVVPKPSLATTAVSSGLCPDSAIAEELLWPEGPSVEYHCNSCSADCSRKRYHCQTQADYDLCADCFSNGKFDPDMSSSDFILMEPAEAPGLSGGKWTDQETLLLLEALEIYKENWNEIAEHVATKTKAQCILHFVQMPIVDAFFDCVDREDSQKEVADTGKTNETAPETSGVKTDSKEDQGRTSPTETSNPQDIKEKNDISENDGGETSNPQDIKERSDISENDVEGKKADQVSKPNTVEGKQADQVSKPDTVEGKQADQVSKPDTVEGKQADQVSQPDTVEGKPTSEISKLDAGEGMAGEKTGEDVALRALTEAFDAVSYVSNSGLSFAEVGNPVMALAAFFVRLVGGDVVSASARNSLKSLSSSSPGVQLALRHCFLLEDPPDSGNEKGDSDRAENTEQNAPVVDNQDEKNQSSSIPNLGSDVMDPSSDPCNIESKVSCEEENKSVDSSNDEAKEKEKTINEVGLGDIHDENDTHTPKDPSNSGQPHNTMDVLSSPESAKEQQDGNFAVARSELKETGGDAEMVSDSRTSQNMEPSTSVVREVPVQAKQVPKDEGIMSDALPVDKNEIQDQEKPSLTADNIEPAAIPKDIDKPYSQPSEEKCINEPISTSTAEDQKNSVKGKPDSEGTGDGCRIDKLKRAGVAALSAAAVKAKLLANQEEDQIRQLAAVLIEKQLHKLEMKLAFFNDLDTVILRVKEQLDRFRQRLYHDRTQIVAARLGIAASSSNPGQPSLAGNRLAMNFAGAFPRPPLGFTSQRPPIPGPPMGATNASNPFNPSGGGNSIRPSSQDTLSSVGTK